MQITFIRVPRSYVTECTICRYVLHNAVVSGLRRGVNEIFALYSCYVVLTGSSHRRLGTAYPSIFKGQAVPKRR